MLQRQKTFLLLVVVVVPYCYISHRLILQLSIAIPALLLFLLLFFFLCKLIFTIAVKDQVFSCLVGITGSSIVQGYLCCVIQCVELRLIHGPTAGAPSSSIISTFPLFCDLIVSAIDTVVFSDPAKTCRGT